MRTKFPHGVVIVVALLGTAGCQSGISMPKFAWGKKTPPASNTALTNAPSAPQLPSAAAGAPTA